MTAVSAENLLKNKSQNFFTGEWNLHMADRNGEVVAVLSKTLGSPADAAVDAMHIQEYAAKKFHGPYAIPGKTTDVKYQPALEGAPATIAIENPEIIKAFLQQMMTLNTKAEHNDDIKHHTSVKLTVENTPRLFPESVPELPFQGKYVSVPQPSQTLLTMVKACGITPRILEHIEVGGNDERSKECAQALADRVFATSRNARYF